MQEKTEENNDNKMFAMAVEQAATRYFKNQIRQLMVEMEIDEIKSIFKDVSEFEDSLKNINAELNKVGRMASHNQDKDFIKRDMMLKAMQRKRLSGLWPMFIAGATFATALSLVPDSFYAQHWGMLATAAIFAALSVVSAKGIINRKAQQ